MTEIRDQVFAKSCRDMSEIPDETIQTVVTSPPYWGLRDYGNEPEIWGGDPECEHEWGDEFSSKTNHLGTARWNHTVNGRGEEQPEKKRVGKPEPVSQGRFCINCPAWRGVLGLEPTPEMYVEHLVNIFREVHRVLRKDGTVWLNLGDSHFGGGNSSGHTEETTNLGRKTRSYGASQPKWKKHPTLKVKDLVGIPWRVALALQADGWWLRSDIIWSKPNPMPGSYKDRPTTAHEYLFLLSKNDRYFYDYDAISEPATWAVPKNGGRRKKTKVPANWDTAPGHHGAFHREGRGDPEYTDPIETTGRRNKRSVWKITTKAYPEAHYATFPPDLVEICIKAGTSEKGACLSCGSPWKRSVKRDPNPSKEANAGDDLSGGAAKTANPQTSKGLHRNSGGVFGNASFLGWEPTCDCNEDSTIPCLAMDPFMGSGTTAMVAKQLGRDYVGYEISNTYIEDHIKPRMMKFKGQRTLLMED